VNGADPSGDRSRRRIVEWTIVGALALVALVLGYVGFGAVYEELGWSERLYRSLQLFVLESGAVPDEEGAVPTSLEIARILAPAVAAYAAIRTIILVFSETAAVIWLRLLRTNHVVVVGLGRKGFALARSLRAAGERVVVVESDPANPFISGSRARDIPVLVGDASDLRVLQRANLSRARALVVVAGDDRTNIDIAFVAARIPVRRDASVPSVFVHLDDLVLWRLLELQAVPLRERLPFRIEFFNVDEQAARVLLEEHPALADPQPHLLVVGPGQLAERLILQAARTWRANGSDGLLPVTVAGKSAAAQLDALLTAYPGLERICQLDSWELDPETPRPGARFTAAYVCVEGDPSGLAAALALATRPGTRRVPVVLAVADESDGVASVLHDDAGLSLLRPFGVLERTMNADLLTRGTNEILAQAKHEHYLLAERERGVTAAENPSIVPWHELDENLKESNRLFADSIGAKLAAAGCTVVPAPLSDPAASAFSFSEDEVEEYARAEHDRWCRDLEAHGWRFGEQKDPQRKLHPKLVPWSELTEDDRDKDREPVRALPEMLARAGFAIERI
jgi:TrkA-N domain/RyR domain